MGYKIDVSRQDRLILACLWGRVRAAEMVDGIRTPPFDPATVQGYDTIAFVAEDTDLSHISPEDARAVAHADRETFLDPGVLDGSAPITKLATACPPGIRQVTMRLFIGLTDYHTDFPEERRVFDTVPDALAWLDRPGPAVEARVRAWCQSAMDGTQ